MFTVTASDPSALVIVALISQAGATSITKDCCSAKAVPVRVSKVALPGGRADRVTVPAEKVPPYMTAADLHLAEAVAEVTPDVRVVDSMVVWVRLQDLSWCLSRSDSLH